MNGGIYMFVIALLRKIIAVFLSFFVLLWSGALFGGGSGNVDYVEG